LLQTLQQYNQVYVSINDSRLRPASKLDYSDDVKSFITQIASQQNTVISVFANAYTIAGLPGIEKCGALLVCYQMTDDLQRSAVKVILQQLKPTGRLPVRINNLFTTGMGKFL
jgi:beta-N-acetylhexosaminidase